ncbi:MAG: hypothetical protein DRI86_12605 [Bacteroidetes bacterium]|nr:MAG: hypothetical protein DRI86_12605 [Bacteroidota bacterium]
MSKSKSFLLWTITVVITISAMFYQRMTGPTYPKKVNIELAGQQYKLKLLRSNEIGSPCDIKIPIEDTDVKAIIFYKRYKVNEEWTKEEMLLKTEDDKTFLSATLPEQPSAGKVEYRIELYKGNEKVNITKDEPVVVRFKGFVPRYILIPHIIFMIISLIVATRAGVEALANGDKTRKFATLTLIALGIGGLILGPLVQLYAFGELWTGWPFGGDWTDNKTIFAWIFWLVAFVVLKKNPHNKLWPIIATIVIFAMYMIPHSMGGSELDNETGKIETGLK